MSDKSIKSHSETHNFFNPSLKHLGAKTRVKFNGSCLKQEKVIYIHRKKGNIYVVYKINKMATQAVIEK